MINAKLKSEDRFKNSALAVAKNRVISIPNIDFKKERKVRVKITRDKHNIFGGRIV